MAARAPARVVPLILAAGRSTRFGSPKVVAPLAGRPLIGHVLDALAGIDLDRPIVVVGDDAAAIRSAVDELDQGADWVVNHDPSAGLSSSLRVGLESIRHGRDAVAALVLLGDQPLVRTDVIRALLEVEDEALPIVAPRYAVGGGHNPVLLRRAGWPLADESVGDRGLGPLLVARPDLVAWVDVAGDNPDVDTPSDLAWLEGRGSQRPG
jgi:molybdenum cofactor cytidylyltransferase